VTVSVVRVRTGMRRADAGPFSASPWALRARRAVVARRVDLGSVRPARGMSISMLRREKNAKLWRHTSAQEGVDDQRPTRNSRGSAHGGCPGW